jgi:DNA mismatch repair protein MutS
MRSVALITIMAQMGSFVPASYAQIGIVDRIFTRVGAFDDLASGQSTFMVEMLELANILNNVTRKSLVILDEIGRGTSTLDGFCIARAVLEFLHGKGSAGPRTLFATHFHEIVGIESELKRVKNYHFAVRDTGKEVVFLRKIIPGATDRSYGIHVAQIAGVPRKVIERAGMIMNEMEGRESHPPGKARRYTQMLLFDAPPVSPDPILKDIEALQLEHMTPIEALTTLHTLQNRVKNGNGTTRTDDSLSPIERTATHEIKKEKNDAAIHTKISSDTQGDQK